MIDFFGNLFGLVIRHFQQEVTIGSCTGTSTAGLNAIAVIQQLYKKIEMYIRIR